MFFYALSECSHHFDIKDAVITPIVPDSNYISVGYERFGDKLFIEKKKDFGDVKFIKVKVETDSVIFIVHYEVIVSKNTTATQVATTPKTEPIKGPEIVDFTTVYEVECTHGIPTKYKSKIKIENITLSDSAREFIRVSYNPETDKLVFSR